MITLKDKLVEIGSVSRKGAFVQLELEEPVRGRDNFVESIRLTDKLKQVPYGADIVFVGRMANSIILVCGTFHKYKEHVGQDFILRRLEIKGQTIGYDS